MPSIVIVEKVGTLKSTNIKTYQEEELYKKAGYKSAEGFKCYTTWEYENKSGKLFISLYGKTSGRANQENKYEFPPPVDTVLFFGSCVLVAKQENGTVVNLTTEMWETIYEELYGGFEDIGDEDSDEDLDDESDIGEVTKSGYQKDGFIVEDDEVDEDEDYEEELPKSKAKATTQKRKYSKKSKQADPVIDEPNTNNMYFDCTSELSEEEYIE
jgi:hypothetical protein